MTHAPGVVELCAVEVFHVQQQEMKEWSVVNENDVGDGAEVANLVPLEVHLSCWLVNAEAKSTPLMLRNDLGASTELLHDHTCSGLAGKMRRRSLSSNPWCAD